MCTSGHNWTRSRTRRAGRTPDQIKKYEDWERDHVQAEGKATVIVAKNRQGSTGNIQLSFIAEFTKFGDLAYSEGPDEY